MSNPKYHVQFFLNMEPWCQELIEVIPVVGDVVAEGTDPAFQNHGTFYRVTKRVLGIDTGDILIYMEPENRAPTRLLPPPEDTSWLKTESSRTRRSRDDGPVYGGDDI